MHKTFWTKICEQWRHLRKKKEITPEQLHIERILLPRLRIMSYLLFLFCALSLSFVAVMTQETNFLIEVSKENGPSSAISLEQAFPPSLFSNDVPDEIELDPMEVLNFYLISCIFAAMGFACLFFAAKKQKELAHTHIPKVTKESISD